MEDRNLTAGDVVEKSVVARGAIMAVLNVDGTFEVSWHGLSYIEALGLLEAAKGDVIYAAQRGDFGDDEEED